jgi:hypothetical protein
MDLLIVAGMKLKQVDGQPIAHLSFYQALELVKAASRCDASSQHLLSNPPFVPVYRADSDAHAIRPVTLSFVDTELPTIGATLGVSATTSGMEASSTSLVSTTDLMSEESSAVYSTDRSQLSSMGDSAHTVRTSFCTVLPEHHRYLNHVRRYLTLVIAVSTPADRKGSGSARWRRSTVG